MAYDRVKDSELYGDFKKRYLNAKEHTK